MSTHVDRVFPAGAADMMTPDTTTSPSLAAKLWCAAYSATMLTIGSVAYVTTPL